jgi:hypothetical protein
MKLQSKVILHCTGRDRSRLDDLVKRFVRDGVKFVGVVGVDCPLVEDMVDELIVGDGSESYDLLTSSHPQETVEQAVEFARSLSGDYSGEVQVVEL